MSHTYLALNIDAAEEESELLQAYLADRAIGLEIRDSEVKFPEFQGPAVGKVALIAFFEDSQEAAQAKIDIAQQFPNAVVNVSSVIDQDWSNAWKSQIKSSTVGRLWVGPQWLQGNAAPDLIPVVIEPKMAFGTGDHPTTRLCLEALDVFLAAHPSASVLDVGTGSGVLAIASRKLGAGRVVGIDNDPVAIDLAIENAHLNQVFGLELSTDSLAQVQGQFDLVVANILANTLIELAPALVERCKDELVLAGVLAEQEVEVRRAYQAHGFKALAPAAEGEWIRLHFKRA